MYSIEQSNNPEFTRDLAIEFLNFLEEEIQPDHFINQWIKFIDAGIGVIFYLKYDGHVVGGIGAIKAPSLLNGKTELIEVFWYVTPRHRKYGLLLYDAMHKFYIDSEGITRFAMIHMEKSMPDKLKHFYTKQGFKLLETHWVKDK